MGDCTMLKDGQPTPQKKLRRKEAADLCKPEVAPWSADGWS
jgi:hypothetical protein